MKSFEYTTTINTLASLITESVSDEEALLLSAIFTQIGDTIATILAYEALKDKKE